MEKHLTMRNGLIAAIVVVAVLLAWSWWRSRRRVLDAANSAYVNGLFDAMNPELANTGGVPTGAG